LSLLMSALLIFLLLPDGNKPNDIIAK